MIFSFISYKEKKNLSSKKEEGLVDSELHDWSHFIDHEAAVAGHIDSRRSPARPVLVSLISWHNVGKARRALSSEYLS